MGLEKMEVDNRESRIIPMDQSQSLSSQHKDRNEPRDERGYFFPGQTITEEAGFVRGHGTYVANGKLISSVAGRVEPINRLISVRPPRVRYEGEVGDVVVGRVSEVQVQQKRWRVETNSRLHSILLISSINLPGGELRRKTVEDERMMRSYFVEGDLISSEVQSIFSDGSLSLHTRSLKYGKLGQGVLVIVSPSLIERSKSHFHNLPCGAHVILGNNGYIWICPTVPEGAETGGFVLNYDRISLSERQVISRLRNCICALAKCNKGIRDTSIMYCYEASLSYTIQQLLQDDIIAGVVRLTDQRLKMLIEID